MFKRNLVLLLFLFFSTSSFSQFLHFGARAYLSPIIQMDYYEYDVTDYVYYFSNERNETIRFSGFESSKIKSNYVSPDLYMRFDWGNHVFFQTDIFSMQFKNEAKYKNSIDYKDFVQSFNPDGNISDLEYNTIKLKWKFIGNSISMGYRISKTKALRPYIFAGISIFYLQDFIHDVPDGSIQTNRDINNIVFTNLDTYKLATYHSHLGLGLKYHAISLDVYGTSSLPSSDIDIYASNYYENNSNNNDIGLSERANYLSLNTLNVSLSINLLSFNLTKKDLKY